jgi:hypothetical protein
MAIDITALYCCLGVQEFQDVLPLGDRLSISHLWASSLGVAHIRSWRTIHISRCFRLASRRRRLASTALRQARTRPMSRRGSPEAITCLKRCRPLRHVIDLGQLLRVRFRGQAQRTGYDRCQAMHQNDPFCRLRKPSFYEAWFSRHIDSVPGQLQRHLRAVRK